jgi:hypothetical protein
VAAAVEEGITATKEEGEDSDGEACGVGDGALDEVPLLWWDVSPRPLPRCDIFLGRERPRWDDHHKLGTNAMLRGFAVRIWKYEGFLPYTGALHS